MSATNPYTPPRANVADIDDTESFQPVRVWSASGRIGRLRYWTYSVVATVLFGVLIAVVTALLGPALGPGVALLAYIPLVVFSILQLIKRSHDMDWSGWMSFLAIIPFVGFIWLFKSGTRGENSFGAPPPPNTMSIKILAFAMPVLYFFLLAAVAIPAYQSYVERARAAQQSQ